MTEVVVITGTIRLVRDGGVQSPVDRKISCSDFRGAFFEINFSGRQRGFDGVLYNL